MNVEPAKNGTAPVTTEKSKPTTDSCHQGKRAARDSPKASRYMAPAAAAITPAMKPPPGRSCPCSKIRSESKSVSGTAMRATVRRIGDSCISPVLRARKQTEHAQTHDHEHGDLADRVHGSEVDDDHVHGVAAAGLAEAAREVVLAEVARLAEAGARAQQHEHEHGQPEESRHRRVPCRERRRQSVLAERRHEVEDQQDDDRRDRLDQDLREQDVGRAVDRVDERDQEAARRERERRAQPRVRANHRHRRHEDQNREPCPGPAQVSRTRPRRARARCRRCRARRS